ncbi:MAG: hypothetical protein GQ474_09190 [Sulfurimonas sp.]|nr:hypothetical protein [Sulfurimonas sp.]
MYNYAMNFLNAVRILIFSLFISLYIIIYIVTTNNKDEQVKLALEQQIENLNNNYKVTTNSFKLISDNLYSMILNQPEIVELFYKAKHSKTESDRTVLREKLYTKMKPYFEQLNKSGVNIMLFSFANNRTFLRVHKPSKYGDDLSAVRYSFTYVNDKKKSIRGLEQGKISHAFRNIFPLYYNDEYIGSVDVAFSSEVFQENMTRLHGTDTHFILDKTLFDANIWEAQEKVKYIQSIEHEGFLFALTSSQSDNAFASEKLQLNRNLKEEISQNIKHHGPFALYYNNGFGFEIIAFSPIKNIKEKKTVAYLVSYTTCHYLENILDKYLLINIMFFIVLLLLSLLISNNIKQRLYLQTRVNQEVEKNKTQQQTMFEQSRLAQMGEMISMIAHQWRQPLASISSISSTLSFDVMMDNYKKEFFAARLDSIADLSQHLSRTIDDFRNFYKPNKQKVALKLEKVISTSLNIIKSSLISENIEITEEYNSKDEIEVYESELSQVILNIFKNAQDNFKEKQTKDPYIKITTENRTISICDNGGGIPEDIIEKIFDPYFSTKDEKNGTGLGLHMSKTIVEEHHNGKLSVENTGDGACFIIEM